MSRSKLALIACALLLLLGLTVLLAVLPARVERRMNVVLSVGAGEVSTRAQEFHDSLLIADLHADSLLWKRDLLQRSDRGHVDFPRLVEGNVALQVFTTVTKSPHGLNYDSNAGSSFDDITLLAVAQLWPPRTWSSLHQRALYQGDKLDEFARRAGGSVLRILRRRDVEELLARRAQGEQLTGALLGTEGLHVLEADLNNVDALYSAGFRMMSLQHFFDNGLGGSLHGSSKHGLTTFGKAVVRRVNELEVILDLSHSSEGVVRDVVRLSTRPLLISHGGVYGHCPGPRNIADELMQQIAARGGLVGIGYWQEAVCGTGVADIVAAIRYGIDLLGVEHVALGSDFDGAVATGFDTAQLAMLTETMLSSGFSTEEIRLVMGGNTLRFLAEQLPE